MNGPGRSITNGLHRLSDIPFLRLWPLALGGGTVGHATAGAAQSWGGLFLTFAARIESSDLALISIKKAEEMIHQTIYFRNMGLQHCQIDTNSRTRACTEQLRITRSGNT